MSDADLSHIPPEVLEEAACGHLPPDRHAAVEAHCAVCAQCRTAYEEELRIARGTRSWARATLKARLASRVAAAPGVRIPWTRILAAAAVLLVIAGTGIVYQWLRVPPDPSASDLIVTGSNDTIIAPGAGTATRDFADERTLHTPPPPGAAKEAVRDGSPTGRAKRETPAPAPAAAPVEAEDALAAVPEARQAVGSMQTGITGELIVWGNVVAADEAKDKGGRMQEIVAEDAAMDARGAQMQGARKMNALPPRRFTVDQEVVLARYRSDTGARSGQVPARISRTADTVRIVLLVDSLMPEAIIRAATVRTFPPDSLQVHVQGRIFGFTTPPGFVP